MEKCFLLFKGATRVPKKFGVPLIPLVAFVLVVGILTLLFGLLCLGFLLPGWALMAAVTKADDRAFRILWLWGATKCTNRMRLIRVAEGGSFWGASSYALVDGRPKTRKSKRW